MRGILQIYKTFFAKFTSFVVFSFFVSGCHTGNEPVSVPQVTVKKEATNSVQAKRTQAGAIVKTRNKIPETPVKNSASGILLSEKQSNHNRQICNALPCNTNPDDRHDPFALPAAFRKQQPVIPEKQNFTPEKVHRKISPQHTSTKRTVTLPELRKPFVSGIFDNGREKLALLHWQQIQGAFRCGEPLGNGYYIKEIAATAVLLYPEKTYSGLKPVTLPLQQ